MLFGGGWWIGCGGPVDVSDESGTNLFLYIYVSGFHISFATLFLWQIVGCTEISFPGLILMCILSRD